MKPRPDRRFSIDEYVRWSDIDAAGVICYGAYVRFFELAETELFRAAGVPYGEVFDRFGIWLPRKRLVCEFHAPAKLDERLRVSAWVQRIGNTSVTLAFEVQPVDTKSTAPVAQPASIATCEIVLVCVDRQTFKPRPLPNELRAALVPFAA